MSATPFNESGDRVPDVAGDIRDFNESNQTHEELWSRARQWNDIVRHSRDEEEAARQGAAAARESHLAVQAEHPRRRASLLRQLIIAALSVALDGVACWFAAQALGNGQTETLLWSGLFLAVLAGGEVALDHYGDRNRKTWRVLAAGLAVFVLGLGVLRFQYLATVGTDGGIAALVGALLFTAATSVFVLAGYRALRAAETIPAWKSRCRARRAARAVEAAVAAVANCVRERDRLIDAYVSRIRTYLLRKCTSSQLPVLEAAIRAHLCGEST